MNYRSIADMNNTIVRNLHRLPRDIDLVVGIPRSGLIAANLVSLTANIPMTDLDSFVAGRIYSSGVTKRRSALDRKAWQMRKVLVLDDSINGGDAMRQARAKLAAAETDAEMIFSAIYGSFATYEEADFIFEEVPWPRLFQWNFMHHKFLGRSCIDFDGVLCLAPAAGNGGSAFADDLSQMRPLYLPTRKVRCLVTARPRADLPRLEAWLTAHRIAYDELIALDLDGARDPAARATAKAALYRGCDAELFIEGEHDQAAGIAQLSGKPVLCTGSQRMIQPGLLQTGLKQAGTAAGRQALVKLAARTMLGERGYGALKRWVSKAA